MPDIVTLGTSINALQHDRCGLEGTHRPAKKGWGKRAKSRVSSGKLRKTAEKTKNFLGERWEWHTILCVFFKGEFGRVLVDFLILVGFYDPQRSWNPLRVIKKVADMMILCGPSVEVSK